jgi:hypothetical protein
VLFRSARIIGEKLCDDFLIEPRHRGDSAALAETSERIRSLLWHCRRNGVRAGFDFWMPGIPASVKPNERGTFIRDQLVALAGNDFDFIGIYEEMCLVKPDVWPLVGEAARAIQAAPPRPTPLSDAAEVPHLARNLLSADKGGNAWSLASGKPPATVTELIDGDDSSHSSVTFETWPVVLELTPERSARVNRVVLKGGNLNWKNQCAPEDVKVEGHIDGTWHTLAEVRDAATRNRHDNALPQVCPFEPVTVDKLRVTVARGSDAGRRYLVLREIEAYLE